MPTSRRVWLLGLGGLGLTPTASAGVRGVLRVVGSADPPYRIFEGRQAGGLYFELLRAAADRVGWTLQIQEVPPARALMMMQKGDADAMVGLLRTAEREQYLHYSRVSLPAEIKAFYTRVDAPPLRQLEDLQGLRVGVQRGKRYGNEFDAQTGLQRIELSDYRSAMAMVQHGRLDVVLMPERQGDRLLRALNLPLRKQKLQLVGETPYLVLARQSPWLTRLGELEQAFDALHTDGSWAAILARY